MTKKIFLTCLLSAGLSTGIYAQISVAKWQPNPVIIDGNPNEWGTNPRFFNAESNVLYEFRNDAQNLYIILK
jgi:hypothetical protein